MLRKHVECPINGLFSWYSPCNELTEKVHATVLQDMEARLRLGSRGFHQVFELPRAERESPPHCGTDCSSSCTQLKKDSILMTSFQDGLSYSVFKTITDQFLRGVDTRGESEVKAQSFKAALAIDAMAKLTTIDNHPMNRVLGFGTKYLKENFSPWVQQHGGWVSASCLKMNLPRTQR